MLLGKVIKQKMIALEQVQVQNVFADIFSHLMRNNSLRKAKKQIAKNVNVKNMGLCQEDQKKQANGGFQEEKDSI